VLVGQHGDGDRRYRARLKIVHLVAEREKATACKFFSGGANMLSNKLLLGDFCRSCRRCLAFPLAVLAEERSGTPKAYRMPRQLDFVFRVGEDNSSWRRTWNKWMEDYPEVAPRPPLGGRCAPLPCGPRPRSSAAVPRPSQVAPARARPRPPGPPTGRPPPAGRPLDRFPPACALLPPARAYPLASRASFPPSVPSPLPLPGIPRPPPPPLRRPIQGTEMD